MFLAPVAGQFTALAEMDVVVDAVVVLDDVQAGVGLTLQLAVAEVAREEDRALCTADLEHRAIGGVGDVVGESRRMASVLAVPSRMAVAYWIIGSYCSAMVSQRIGRVSAGVRPGYACGAPVSGRWSIRWLIRLIRGSRPMTNDLAKTSAKAFVSRMGR